MRKIEDMTSSEAHQELERLGERRREVTARQRAIRPPAPARAAPEGGGYGGDRDPLAGAGEDYRTAHNAQDVKALAALEEERDELRAEATMLDIRREELRQHARRAAELERREAAPKEAKRLAKAASKLVETYAKAIEAADAAAGELEGVLRELGEARKLAGDDAAGLDPATLGVYLRAKHGTDGRGEVDVAASGAPGTDEAVPAALVRDADPVLAVPGDAVDAVAEFLGRGVDGGQLEGVRARERRDQATRLVRDELIRAIAAGEELEGEDLVRRAVERTAPPASRPRTRAALDSWLSRRSRDAVLAG